MGDERGYRDQEIQLKRQIAQGIKPKDLLLIRKFVRRMMDNNRRNVNGQIFEKAANLVP